MDASLISSSNLAAAIVCPVLATGFVILRFVCRVRYHQGVGIDDWMTVFALLMSWFLSINSFVAGAMAGVSTIKVPPLEAAVIFIRALWISALAMRLALGSVKLAVLLLFHRIFVTRPARIATWITIALVAGWMISTFVAQFLITTPLEKAWDPLHTDTNYSYPKFGVGSAAISLALDIITLMIPIYPVAKLQMPWRRKLAVIGIFWLGGFCCIAGAVRLYYLNASISQTAASTNDNRYNIVTHAYTWVHIEVNVSLIAACLPTLGQLFRSSILPAWAQRLSSAFSTSNIRTGLLGRLYGHSSSAHDDDLEEKGTALKHDNSIRRTTKVSVNAEHSSIQAQDSDPGFLSYNDGGSTISTAHAVSLGSKPSRE